MPDAVSFQWQREGFVWNAPEEGEEEEVCTASAPAQEPPRPGFRFSLRDLLEAAATAATLILVITVWLQFLF